MHARACAFIGNTICGCARVRRQVDHQSVRSLSAAQVPSWALDLPGFASHRVHASPPSVYDCRGKKYSIRSHNAHTPARTRARMPAPAPTHSGPPPGGGSHPRRSRHQGHHRLSAQVSPLTWSRLRTRRLRIMCLGSACACARPNPSPPRPAPSLPPSWMHAAASCGRCSPLPPSLPPAAGSRRTRASERPGHLASLPLSHRWAAAGPAAPRQGLVESHRIARQRLAIRDSVKMSASAIRRFGNS